MKSTFISCLCEILNKLSRLVLCVSDKCFMTMNDQVSKSNTEEEKKKYIFTHYIRYKIAMLYYNTE